MYCTLLGRQRSGDQPGSAWSLCCREEARLPWHTIQVGYLDTVHGSHLSNVVGASWTPPAESLPQPQTELAGILERVRGSPVVHADETGWREDGHNGYVWTSRTPAERYLLRQGLSLRPVVISRKISGGTRPKQGTDTKMTLASIFGTWRTQGLNSLTACRQLLTSPQP